MKIEYPSNLIEFILAGILIEASFLFLIPETAIVQMSAIKNNLFFGLVLVSGAYLCGLSFNSIASFYFFWAIEKKIRKKYLIKNKPYILLAKEEIEKLFGIEINDNIDDLKKLNYLMHNYTVQQSEPYSHDYNYQMRLYRMSRTSFMIVVYWLLLLILSSFGLFSNSILMTVINSNSILFYFLLTILIFFAVSLHLAATQRITYLAGNSFSHFVSIIKMKNLVKKE